MLKTDYTNDILDTSKNTERVYNLKNASGEIVEENIRIEDITEYSQEGSKFGANDINATNQMVNILESNVNNINLYVGADEKLHFVNKDGADSALPFSNTIKSTQDITLPYTATKKCMVMVDVTYLSRWYEDDQNPVTLTIDLSISTNGNVVCNSPYSYDGYARTGEVNHWNKYRHITQIIVLERGQSITSINYSSGSGAHHSTDLKQSVKLLNTM